MLACGELDAERATASMGAIDDVFQRPTYQMVPSDAVAQAALLEGYIAHRHTAMLSLPRLQRLGDGRPSTTSTLRSEHRLSWWRAAIRALRHGDTR